jgi:hypothetical protein
MDRFCLFQIRFALLVFLESIDRSCLEESEPYVGGVAIEDSSPLYESLEKSLDKSGDCTHLFINSLKLF